MHTSIVKLEHLSHRYSASWAIRDINIEVNTNGVMGLLGSNGAGKSTTMNILCGVLNQTEGNVYIEGIDIRKHPLQAKRLIGFLPQQAPLYLELTVREYLTHCAYMRQMEPKQVPGAVDEAMARCGITHFAKRVIRNLSGGYRQRCGIAQAIIHKPRLVVLDEPTNGLDPNQILEVRKLIKEIAEDRVVLFSSHILSEVQAICKDIRMIEHGKLVFEGSTWEFNNYITPSTLIVEIEELPSRSDLLSIEGIKEVEFLDKQRARLKFAQEAGIIQRVLDVSMQRGWRLLGIYMERSSMDEVFAKLSKNTSKQSLKP